MSTFSDVYTKYVGEGEGRGQSGKLWKNCPAAELAYDLSRGYIFTDDFLTLPTSGEKYTLTDTTPTEGPATFALGDDEGGVAILDTAAAVVAEGGQIQLNTTVGAAFFTQATGSLWFEARVKCADIATGAEFFCGLSESDTTIIAASANSSANHIGFESVTDDNVLLFHAEVAGVRTSSTATIHTLVEDTYVKLGFKVTNRDKIEVYVDGVKVDTLTAGFPLVGMVPSLVCQVGTTGEDVITHLDWWSVAVENSPN